VNTLIIIDDYRIVMRFVDHYRLEYKPKHGISIDTKDPVKVLHQRSVMKALEAEHASAEDDMTSLTKTPSKVSSGRRSKRATKISNQEPERQVSPIVPKKRQKQGKLKFESQ
jgi:hypothetical protein